MNQSNASSKRPSVLVVEDNDEIRSFVTTILKDSQYSVFEAADGQAALDFLLKQRHQNYLLIADIILPKQNADTTIEMAKAQGVNFHGIVFITGEWYIGAKPAKMIAQNEAKFLQKPFKREDLLEVVKSFG